MYMQQQQQPVVGGEQPFYRAGDRPPVFVSPDDGQGFVVRDGQKFLLNGHPGGGGQGLLLREPGFQDQG